MPREKLIQRIWQLLLIVGTIGFSWLGLQVVHESGHAFHAWLSGGPIKEVILYPTALSQTSVEPNPHPCFVAWGGPIWGCLIPLVLWGLVWTAARRYAFLARFFAGACLVANGAYLGASALLKGQYLDGQVILKHGGQMWQLLLFSLITLAAGFYLWNGLGAHFGLGKSAEQVERRVTIVAVVLLTLTATLEWAIAS